MKNLKERKKEVILMFGQEIPKWKDCPECGSKLSCEFMTYSHASCCQECKEKKEKEARERGEVLEDKSGPTFVIKHHKDITSVFKDKRTGQFVGVDDKGRKVDMKDTIYDLKNDPHGWKAAGHKVRNTAKFGRKNV